MTARCPFCEAVHPIQAGPASDTYADVVDDTLSIVWGREWWRRWVSAPLD